MRLRRFVRLLGALLGNLFPLVTTLVLLLWSLLLLAQPPSSARSGASLISGLPPESLGPRLAAAGLFAGLAATALLEVIKRLVGLRGLYQQRQIRLWLQERLRVDDRDTRHLSPHLELEFLVGVLTSEEFHLAREYYGIRRLGSSRFRGSVDGLSRYSTTRRLARFYDLPIERLTAQIYAAMDMVVQEPGRFPVLMEAVTGRPMADREFGSERFDMEVAQSVRAGIDALHIDVGEGWRNYVRGTAVWISGLTGVVVVSWSSVSQLRDAGAYILVSLVVGGFFSWFVRDLSAVIERWRR